MADKDTDPLKISPEMRAFTEKSVDQAQKAFYSFMSATQKALGETEGAVDGATGSMRDVGKQVLSATEETMDAAFTQARRIANATGIDEVIRLQNEFLRQQMAALGEQTRLISEAAARLNPAAKD